MTEAHDLANKFNAAITNEKPLIVLDAVAILLATHAVKQDEATRCQMLSMVVGEYGIALASLLERRKYGACS